MKKCKLYIQISFIIVLTFICVTFFACIAYYLYTNNSGMAGVFATLVGIIITLARLF